MSKLTRTPGWIAPLLAGALALGGCSYTGEPEGVPADVSGFWRVWVTEDVEDATEVGPVAVHFTQDAGALDGLDAMGTVSGNRLVWHPGLRDLATTETYLGTVDGELATGTFTVEGLAPASGTWRAERFVPVGTISADGAVAGLPVALAGAPAFGRRLYGDALRTTLAEVAVVYLDAGRGLELRFEPAGLAVGTLEIPAVAAVEVSLATDDEEHALPGVAGTLEVTKYDGTGFTATFTIDLGGGETVTGSFDVAFDVDAYLP